MPTKKEWTLIFYFASDNPLAPGVISQLKAIKAAGFHQDANVIVQFDPQTETFPTHVFDVNVIKKAESKVTHNIGFTANDPNVQNLLEDRLWRDELDRDGVLIRKRLTEKYSNYNPGIPPNGTVATDSIETELGPQKSLHNFLTFCAESYPANHYIIFFLGHGVVVGNDVFMFDEHAEEHTLTLGGLGTVLKDFNTKIKGHQGTLELLSFHSCSVSALEVAYELKDHARYMLASQGSTLIGNWPYHQILIRLFNELVKNGNVPQIRSIFEEIFGYCVSNSTDFLLAGYPFDLCLCELRKMTDLKTAIDQLSQALMKGMECENYKEAILLAHLESQSFHYEMYTDLWDFCRCLYERTLQPVSDAKRELCRTGIQNAVRMVTSAIRNCIVRSAFAGPEYQYAGGLSIYFPWSTPVDNVLEKYGFYQLAAQIPGRMTWFHFLKAYLEQTQRAPISEQKGNPIAALGETHEALVTGNVPERELLEDQIAVVYGQAAVQYTGYTLDGDKPEKTDAGDPLGGCSIPSIKNYPRDTRRLKERKQALPESVPLAVDPPPKRLLKLT